MGTGYMVDTNIAIYTLKGILPENATAFLASILDEGCMISVISKIELMGFPFPEMDDEIKTQRFVEESTLLPLSDVVVDKAIEIRKSQKIKLGDAIIAATALANGLTLLTRNESDFKNIPDLKLVNPFLV